MPLRWLFEEASDPIRRGWKSRLQPADVWRASDGVVSGKLVGRYDACAGGYRWRMWVLARGRLALSGVLYLLYAITQVRLAAGAGSLSAILGRTRWR